MPKPLRVLIVEDSEDDAQLLLRELRKADYAPIYTRVDTATELQKALDTQSWDIVISDHSMPQFDAPSALKIIREKLIDIPFILVSGSIGEDKAVEIMKSGAQDFIAKDKLGWLIPAIERELREAENRRKQREADEALRAAGKEWRTTFDAIADAVCLLALDGKVVRCNRAFRDFCNKPFKEIIGQFIWKVAYDSDKSPEDCAFQRMLQSKHRETGLHQFNHRWFQCIIDPIKNEADELTGAVFILIDMTKQREAEEALAKSYTNLRRVLDETVNALASALEIRDPYTAGHERRDAQLAIAIAKEMGLSDDQIEGLRIGALLHDIGKIAVPAEILTKPGKLTEIEFGLIKVHPQVGFDILKVVEFPWPIAQIVYQHQERLNGSGYPRGLKEDQIILEARILMVADVVEAMSSHRPYRPALGIDKALEEIEKNKGILYDPVVADACIRVFREKGFQFE
jgi:PAS domain S-box-containing protein/putative nucleotidyltransferase with HDIG domain